MKTNAAAQQVGEQLAVTTGFDSETLTASNDIAYVAEDPSLEELRSKIKAARLEKLMARQLESELSVDEINFEPSLDDLDLAVDSTVAENVPQAPRAFLTSAAPDLASRSSATDPRSRFKTNRQDCEDLLEDFREHAHLMTRISEKSNSFLDYLNRVEQEFSSMDSMEMELREKTRELERIEKQRQEHKTLVEKQRKQIDLLETMRKTSVENYDNAKHQLDELQLQSEQQAGKLNEAHAMLSRFERETVAWSEKYETMRVEYEKASSMVASLRRQNHDQDRQLSQTVGELNDLKTENEQNLHELSNLQIKYNELNKKSLEHQSQHYTKIAELEETVRAMKGQLDQRNREKADLVNELEAANNLLVLHEEMISALSPQRRA